MYNETIKIKTKIQPCKSVNLGCTIHDIENVKLNATIKEGQIGQEVKRDIAELKEDVAEINEELVVINEEIDTTNERITEEVEVLDDKINTKVETVTGDSLINVTRTGNSVFITSKTFIFEQAVASDRWVITHNLNKRPGVTIVDSAGSVFEPAVQYVDDNTCIAEMLGATTGNAYLN